jgi:hypothetical protein
MSRLGESLDDFIKAVEPWLLRLGFLFVIGGLCVWPLAAVCYVFLGLLALFFSGVAGLLAVFL